MKKTLLHILFFLVAVSGALSAQQPQTIKLTQLETAQTVESSKAGQIGLTNTSGKQRYAQYVEIDLTPIAGIPTSTGNTANYSEFVTASDGTKWYIDWQGRGYQFPAGSGTDKNGYYGGNNGNGGDQTIPSATTSTLTNQLTLAIATSPPGGTIPFRINVLDGSDFADFMSLKSGPDSLLFWVSDDNFVIHASTNADLELSAGGTVQIDGDSVSVTSVANAFTGEKTFLMRSPNGYVTKKEGIAPGDISLANAHILVGNSSGYAADVAMSQDVTVTNTGVASVGGTSTSGYYVPWSGNVPAGTVDDWEVRTFTSFIQTAAVTITGLTNTAPNVGTAAVSVMRNDGIGNITFKNQNTGSAAGNRIALPFSQDYVLYPTEAVTMYRYGGQWQIVSRADLPNIDTFSVSGSVVSLSIRKDGQPAKTITIPAGSVNTLYNANDALTTDRFVSGAGHHLYLGTSGSPVDVFSFNTPEQTWVTNTTGSYTGLTSQTVTKPWYLQGISNNGGVNESYRGDFGGIFLGGRMNSRLDDLGRWQLFYSGDGDQERATMQWAVSELSGAINHYLRYDHFGRFCIDCGDFGTGTTTSGGSGADTVVYKFEVRAPTSGGGSLAAGATGAKIIGNSVIQGNFKVTDTSPNTADVLIGANNGTKVLSRLRLGTNLSITDSTLNAAGSASLWTDGGATTYLIATGDNVAIGSTTAASKLDVVNNSLSIAQTNTSGALLSNTTAAAVGAQQISPALRWRGFGWGTTAGTSQSVDWRSYVLPVQSTVPSGELIFESDIAGAGYTTGFVLRKTATATVASIGGMTIDVNHGLRVRAPGTTGSAYALAMYSSASSFVGGFTALGQYTFSNGFQTFGSSNAATTTLGGREIQWMNDEALQSGDFGMRFQQQGNKNITTGSLGGYRFGATNYNPTSGSANFIHFQVVPTWNQTGTASGDLIGIDYAPVLTGVLGNHYGLLIRSGKAGFGTSAPATQVHINTSAATTTAIQRWENSSIDFDVFGITASPESSVTASPGDYAHGTISGVGALYIKETGSATNTGWAKAITSLTAAGGSLTGTYPSPTIATSAVTSAMILDGTIALGDMAAQSFGQQLSYGTSGAPTATPASWGGLTSTNASFTTTDSQRFIVLTGGTTQTVTLNTPASLPANSGFEKTIVNRCPDDWDLVGSLRIVSTGSTAASVTISTHTVRNLIWDSVNSEWLVF